MNNFLNRTALLIGESSLERLKQSHVLVVGVGGVGVGGVAHPHGPGPEYPG